MTNFTQNLAIAIGINQYQNGIAKLSTAKPDAETLADLLRDEYQYQVELITDDTASPHRKNLRTRSPRSCQKNSSHLPKTIACSSTLPDTGCPSKATTDRLESSKS
jgi:hypothetical protein